jgi:Concanavalin A-like lectin/glucanases superfamily
MRTHLEKTGTLVGLRVCLIVLFLLATAVSSSISNANVNIETVANLAGQSCLTLPPGIVSWWSGEGHAQDSVGGNHGSLQGGTTFASGMVGQAFSFEEGDSVSIPFNENYNFDPAGQFTIEAWVKPGQSIEFQALVVRDRDAWDWGLWQNFDKFVTGHGQVSSNLTGQIAVQIDEWVHVAVTYDNGIHNLYVNGVLDTLSGIQSPITQSNAGLAFGRGVDRWYQGLLDEITIYDRALSQGEIAAIVAAGSAGKCSRLFLPAVLNNYCPFCEIEPNDVVNDATGPLVSGQNYIGDPDENGSNQDSDYYYIDLATAGTITISVTDFLAIGQVQLYYQTTADLKVTVADQPNGNYQITYSGNAGRYYIRVVAPDGHATGNGNYSLQVNYP